MAQRLEEITRSDKYIISPQYIKSCIESYGFIEVADIIQFLPLIKSGQPETCEYFYVRAKIGACLRRYDNGSDYFIPLRELACELDCILQGGNFLLYSEFCSDRIS